MNVFYVAGRVMKYFCDCRTHHICLSQDLMLSR